MGSPPAGRCRHPGNQEVLLNGWRRKQRGPTTPRSGAARRPHRQARRRPAEAPRSGADRRALRRRRRRCWQQDARSTRRLSESPLPGRSTRPELRAPPRCRRSPRRQPRGGRPGASPRWWHGAGARRLVRPPIGPPRAAPGARGLRGLPPRRPSRGWEGLAPPRASPLWHGAVEQGGSRSSGSRRSGEATLPLGGTPALT
mmetsp:Transcript_20748/g.52989  ORF Transcript_20748/g.52989 Transcript_20748/m.52989 type:complete len:200 (-) Transcript_20748:593-1192(-)